MSQNAIPRQEGYLRHLTSGSTELRWAMKHKMKPEMALWVLSCLLPSFKTVISSANEWGLKPKSGKSLILISHVPVLGSDVGLGFHPCLKKHCICQSSGRDEQWTLRKTTNSQNRFFPQRALIEYLPQSLQSPEHLECIREPYLSRWTLEDLTALCVLGTRAPVALGTLMLAGNQHPTDLLTG